MLTSNLVKLVLPSSLKDSNEMRILGNSTAVFEQYYATNVSSDNEFTKINFPSAAPTSSLHPTSSPTRETSQFPSYFPTKNLSESPSGSPTKNLSESPSSFSTKSPSGVPSSLPSTFPTNEPSQSPSLLISELPSSFPTTDLAFTESCGAKDYTKLDPPPVKFMINFDYEIVLNSNVTDSSSVVRSLENHILEDLASQFLECDPKDRRVKRTVRGRFLEDFEQQTGIVQIESAPFDLPDFDQVSCAETADIVDETFCIPYKGAMSYYSTCPSCPPQENNLLSAIKSGCDNDAYIDGSIKQVHFIGERFEVPLVISVNDNVKEETNPAPDVGMGGFFTFFLIAGVLAILTAIQVYRKKSKKKEQLDNGSEDGESSVEEIDEV